MNENLIYEERLSSNWTEALFVILTMLFLLLLILCVNADGPTFLKASFMVITLMFLFYSLNYRTLIIRITPQALNFKFGIFTWSISLDNIEDCQLDDLPLFMKYGGAGIHFMMIRKRYRASFNFLEYPRVVIALKQKKGPVRDISFTTRHPEQVIRHLKNATTSSL